MIIEPAADDPNITFIGAEQDQYLNPKELFELAEKLLARYVEVMK